MGGERGGEEKREQDEREMSEMIKRTLSTG